MDIEKEKWIETLESAELSDHDEPYRYDSLDDADDADEVKKIPHENRLRTLTHDHVKVSKEYYRGCLLGGAVADAKCLALKEFGRDLISDNTQMAYFTLDGLYWADSRAKRRGVYAYIPCLFYAYQKWYYTQTGSLSDDRYDFILQGEILRWEELFARRGKGMTSINALASSINGKYGTITNRINQNNTCGAVNRVAPIGMYFPGDIKMAFRVGCDSAAITHGHTNAIYSSGFMAALISSIFAGNSIKEAAYKGLSCLREKPEAADVAKAIGKALILSDELDDYRMLLRQIGLGYTSEEAVAIAVLIAIRFSDDFESAINAAIVYGGNTDSIPPLIGSILGTYLGSLEIPYRWVQKLELAELAVYGADKLLTRVKENGGW
ncbi:MAG: ADP-ribosylglycohydrolase family protein [Clostridiales Family XIII bacterium]|jgi:ADP-ribosylglycohydrolase|nr:ADP-ribosylglycohydrolase family protein [Clostridiales Family XIII bacterium]